VAIGRPIKKRYFFSGEKLLYALKLNGLTWGTNTQVGTHVLNNTRWSQHCLPRSANTLIEDIKHGIPQDRILNYAKFFCIDPKYFIDDSISPDSKEFENEIIQQRYLMETEIQFPILSVDNRFSKAFYEQNHRLKDSKLYDLLEGVYIIYFQEVKSKTISKCVTHMQALNELFLSAKSYASYYNIDTFIYSIIFKWSTFLHINYYSHNCSIIGYMIAHDPTCLVSSLYKKPLTIDLYGIAGGFASSSIPDRFHGYAEKQEVPDDMDDADYYRELCVSVSRSPTVEEGDAQYAAIQARIQRIQNADSNS